jgi:outer membrane protein TolC
VLTSQFELNRVRNRPREDVVIPAPSSIDEHGFVYTSEVIAKAVALPDADRRLRDSLVRFGLDRSPTLRAIDAAIEAEERVLTASKREFWVPTVSVSANVDHVLDSNASSTPFSETEWGARALLTYPVFVGGAKIASLRSAREAVSSLRLARRAETITLDDGIRTAFAQASGAYQTVGFAREQERAAQKNYEYVYDAFVLGVADYLQLLDAQNQNLVAQLASANALYDFLDALIAAEQQIAFFPFLEARAEVDTFIDGLEDTLQARP